MVERRERKVGCVPMEHVARVDMLTEDRWRSINRKVSTNEWLSTEDRLCADGWNVSMSIDAKKKQSATTDAEGLKEGIGCCMPMETK